MAAPGAGARSTGSRQALPGLLDPLCTAGLLERSVGEVRARVDVRPYAADDLDLWVASDLTPGPRRPARPGWRPTTSSAISSAATSLAQLTVREPVDRALDLGTGCGVQALHLAAHAEQVVATDVNQRALRLTGFNAELNGVADRIEVREGSFFEPVAGERFDLVVTNPPFVISPATGSASSTATRACPGDRVVEHIVRGVPDVLAEGGTAQVLANWMIHRDQPWDERLAGWIEAGCDAWVVQREVVDLPTYVELWLKDAGRARRRRTTTSATTPGCPGSTSRARRPSGFGWINLRRSDATSRPSASRTGPTTSSSRSAPRSATSSRASPRCASLSDDQLGAARLVARPDLRQETYGAPGAADPAEIVLRQQRLLRRGRQVDTVEAALVGACDGELTVDQILAALGQLLDREPRTCARRTSRSCATWSPRVSCVLS